MITVFSEQGQGKVNKCLLLTGQIVQLNFIGVFLSFCFFVIISCYAMNLLPGQIVQLNFNGVFFSL